MLTQLQSLAALKIGLFFCHRAKYCFSFPSLLAMTVFFFPHRRNSLSCIGAKRNLSNPAGLIEFCFCDYNLNASKITLKGFIWQLQYYPAGSNQIIKICVNTASDRGADGEVDWCMRKMEQERDWGGGERKWDAHKDERGSGDHCQLCENEKVESCYQSLRSIRLSSKAQAVKKSLKKKKRKKKRRALGICTGPSRAFRRT